MKLQQTSIRMTIQILATPQQVYDMYMDPKLQTAFTESLATSDPRVNGRFTAWEGYISGKYLELEPGKRIVQEWQTTDWPPGYPPSRLELQLIATSEGTQINMIQGKVPQSQTNSLLRGWNEFYWQPLDAYFRSK